MLMYIKNKIKLLVLKDISVFIVKSFPMNFYRKPFPMHFYRKSLLAIKEKNSDKFKPTLNRTKLLTHT